MSEPQLDPPNTTDPGAAADDEMLAALADDFAARIRRQEHPKVEQYVAQHPHLEERIRKVLSAVALIEEARSIDSLPGGEGPGSIIGRYKLLERIGEGGFGVVYMAEQHHPVRRRVALKIVKPGMDSRQVLARFEAERQALAIMDHPNIAKVFDGGMTDSGRLYFVMELVKGEPITQFCDATQLPPRQRLELFLQVCRAVQHAHQKGIIHRDIKPSNVLVAMHDTTPVVKVIDFGVAKALGAELTEKTLFTGYAQLLGTPLYMSPEQAGQSALDVDTRSDIYSLGVLLYELLTGTTPFDKDRFRKAAQDEIRRIIREEEPPKPSTRLSESKKTLASISAQRHTEPAKLTRLMRGELDWIVMKALEKDRGRRYETANGFAKDIERYLNDEAVQACPASAAYRLKKFARRNKGPVVMASVMSLAVLIVVGSLGWMVRDRTAREQQLAGDRAARQTMTNERVTLALEEARKRHQQGRWREGLDAAKRAEALAATGGSDEQTHHRAREVLGDMQMLAKLEDVLVRSTKNPAGYDLKEEDSGYAQAFREYGIDIDALDRDEAASRIRNRSIRYELTELLDNWSYVRRRLASRGSTPIGKDSRELLEVARAADPDPWRDSFRKALLTGGRKALVELARSVPVSSLPAASVGSLGDALMGEGAIKEAVAILKRAQWLHPEDYWLNINLGNCLTALGPQHLDEAIHYYTAAVALRPEAANAYSNLGSALAAQGNLEEAIACYHKAIELGPKKSSAHYRLAAALDRQGKPNEAAAANREATRLKADEVDAAVAGYREALRLKPDDHVAQYYLGRLLGRQGKLDEASAAYKEALRLKPEVMTEGIVDSLAFHLVSYADSVAAQRRMRVGVDPVWDFVVSDPKGRNPKRVLELVKQIIAGDPSPEILALCAPMLLLADDTDAYRQLCARLIAKLRDTTEPRAACLVARICTLAPDSVVDAAKLVEIAQRSVGAQPVPQHQHTLGLAHYRAGEFEDAVKQLHTSIDGNWNANAANWLVLAMAHHRLGQADEARKWFDKAVQWIDSTGPEAQNNSASPLSSLNGRLDSLACLVLRREAQQLLGK